MTIIVREGIEFEITELADDEIFGDEENRVRRVKLNGVQTYRADVEFYLRVLPSFYKNKEMKEKMKCYDFRLYVFDVIYIKSTTLPTSVFNRDDIDKPFFGLFPEIDYKE